MLRTSLHRVALLAAALLVAACGATAGPPAAPSQTAGARGVDAAEPAAPGAAPGAPPQAAPTPGRTQATRDASVQTAAPPPEPREPERPVAGRAEVEIPAIGVTAPLIALGLNDDRTMEVPTQRGLAGWYQYSPAPGARGPAIIAAHVSLQGRPDVFYRLGELEAGDEVSVRYDDGTAITFVVYAVEQHPKEGFPTEQVYGDTEGPELRLITCGGEFDRSARSFRDNVIAYARIAVTS